MKLYKCSVCGKIIVVNDSHTSIPTICCGKVMEELKINQDEMVNEKHIPTFNLSGSTLTVKVGSVVHPNLKEHHIEFIILEKETGYEIKYLDYKNEPVTSFKITDNEKLISVYSYCNIHGLWRKEF